MVLAIGLLVAYADDTDPLFPGFADHRRHELKVRYLSRRLKGISPSTDLGDPGRAGV
ncbi:hypothetical protein [Micromonospora sp. Llam0]|uniref:hypothetical protein n=1 Tax=Micromonospora sp. Llam0 TaxID=2485143 RepID=UPI0013150E2E|nr:hypothetical protein [Micromonospora sp. Llam0]